MYSGSSGDFLLFLFLKTTLYHYLKWKESVCKLTMLVSQQLLSKIAAIHILVRDPPSLFKFNDTERVIMVSDGHTEIYSVCKHRHSLFHVISRYMQSLQKCTS